MPIDIKNFRWNNIASEMEWTLNLTYKNEVGVNEPWVEILMNSKRRFVKVKVDECLELGKNQMVDLFRKHGSRIQELTLTDCVFEDTQLFLDILEAMPKLKDSCYMKQQH